MTKIEGRQIKIGTVVNLWFNHKAVAVSIKPYKGNLSHLWPNGARNIEFTSATAKGKTPMTVGNDELFELVADAEIEQEIYTKELKQALGYALEWIDAIPQELADQLPAMPGFDRDWAESLLKKD